MTAIDEAYRVVRDAPLDVLRSQIMPLPVDLWARLQGEMTVWCDEQGRCMLSLEGFDRPNFLFRGVFVYPSRTE